MDQEKINKLKHRTGENKYKAIPKAILYEIIDEIKEDGNNYFDITLKEITD